MRIPLGVSIESRDGTVDQDAKVMNGVVEMKGEDAVIRKRPGVEDLGAVRVGTAQLLTVWNGVKTIQGDVINAGTIGTIVSAPVQQSLSPTNTGLQFDSQATNNDATTPRLMFKNRTQAWTINRAGTLAGITYASTMGAGTYTLISLTRSGTTATATLAEDVFNVGDSVTIAGAGEAAYNGAQTVTAITAGSSAPAVDVSITSLTRSGTTATATTDGAHGLTSGVSYTIAGANQSAYNGAFTITTTGTATFTYTVTVSAGSYATWNPADKDAGITLSGGNLTATQSASPSNPGAVRATQGKTTGKWYWEVTIGTGNLGAHAVGIGKATMSLENGPYGADGWAMLSYGVKIAGGTTSAYGSGFSEFDVIGVALDLDSGTLTFYKNGVSQGEAFSGLSGTIYPMYYGNNNTGSSTTNFGATSFTHTAPTGHVAVSTESPISPATGTITVARPGATTNPTFSYTVSGSPATPATGTITAQGNGGTVPGIAYINGYFCVMDVNGVIWHSNSDDPGTWGALAFTTAQVENGAGKAIAKSQNYLVAFKEWSTELFYDAGNGTGSAFSPVENGFTRIGCANGFSVADVDGKLFWIGQTREEEGKGVYMGVGLDQVKISTPDIDRIIGTDTLATVHAYGLSFGGHHLYVLTLVNAQWGGGTGITLAYDLSSKAWTQLTSLTLAGNISVSSIVRSGTTATVTTATAHSVSDGDPVKISGATQTEYNGIFQARVVSTTVFKIEVTGGPPTPATGTIVSNAYTESYFKFTKAASYSGAILLLHESDGHLYRLDPELRQDAGIPINFFARTARIDGGTTNLKKMPALRVIGDNRGDTAMLRWSDDDSITFTAYRIVNIQSKQPELRRCGSFRRRTIDFRYVGNKLMQINGLEAEIV